MNATTNKKLFQEIFEALSRGDDKRFIESMADEMRWVWMGSGQWSKVFDGKKAVLGELWSAIKQTLQYPYKVTANNFVADGDCVVVEAIGENTTPDGRTYQNRYCWVCRMANGLIYELKEYMDTDLVTRTFTDTPIRIIGKKFLFDFGPNKAIIRFLSENSLQFTIVQKDDLVHDETEMVEITLTAIRPNIYLASWKEKNGNTISQVQDFLNQTVISNWTTPGGEFISVHGSICTIDE